jgi:hypothetical protein
MTENDSRRGAETRRERAFHSPSSSHQAVSPFRGFQTPIFLSFSASLRLCARSLPHGDGQDLVALPIASPDRGGDVLVALGRRHFLRAKSGPGIGIGIAIGIGIGIGSSPTSSFSIPIPMPMPIPTRGARAVGRAPGLSSLCGVGPAFRRWGRARDRDRFRRRPFGLFPLSRRG